jgi:hypothetical protein
MATLPYEVFANDSAIGTLASDPTTGTTLTLTTGHGARFPVITSGVNVMRVRVYDATASVATGAQTTGEIMLVTAHASSADTMTVTRGQEGTSNGAHAAGQVVEAVETAESQRRWVNTYTPHPRHQNLLAWNMRPGEISGGPTLTSGQPYYARMYVPEDMTVTGVAFGLQTAGTSGTYSTSFVGLYTGSGTSWTRAAVSADRTTDFNSGVTSQGPKRLPFSGTVNVTGGPDTFVIVGIVATFTAGSMVLRGNTAGGHSLTFLTAGTDILWFWTQGTAQTALPTTLDPITSITTSAVLAV